MAASTARDSTVWVLSPQGQAHVYHIQVRAATDDAETRVESSRNLGAWYVAGDLSDSAHRELCVNRRPGRNGSSCQRFTLDTLPGGAGSLPLRRLILFGTANGGSAPPTGLVLEAPL